MNRPWYGQVTFGAMIVRLRRLGKHDQHKDPPEQREEPQEEHRTRRRGTAAKLLPRND